MPALLLLVGAALCCLGADVVAGCDAEDAALAVGAAEDEGEDDDDDVRWAARGWPRP